MILVTGVSGGLGGLIHAGLAADGGVEVAAGSRAGGTEASGVREVRRIDFEDPATLAEGFEGVDVLVFVSAGFGEDDVVLARHEAVVAAAAATGVRHVIYTSVAASGTSLSFAPPHRWTEARLAAAPFDVTVLRNGLYAELPASVAALGAQGAAVSGVFAAPFGSGTLPVVARADLADVAVRVAADSDRDLAGGGRSRHAGRVYELEGVSALGGDDLAEALAAVLGRPVAYRGVPIADTREAFTAAGLPAFQIGHSLSILSHIAAGALPVGANDLPELLPAPPRPAKEVFTATLRALLSA